MGQDAGNSLKRRNFRPYAVAKLTAGVAKRAYARRGFADGRLLLQWERLVGPELARHTMPEKVVRGLLHLWVDSGSLCLEIQHLEPQLLERINGYYGFRAVTGLRTVQRPLPSRPKPPAEVPALSAEETERLDAQVSVVSEPGLREALRKLGSALRRRPKALK